MDEVDDILDQNRAAQQDVEDEDEEEEDDEEDETILRNNMDKDAEERGQDGNNDDQEGPDDDEDEEDDDQGDNEEVDDEDNDDDDDDDEEDDDEEEDEEEDEGEDEGDEDALEKSDKEPNSEKERISRENGRSAHEGGEAGQPEDAGNEDDKMDVDAEEDDEEQAAAAKQRLSDSNDVHNYYTQMLHSAKIASSYRIYPTAAIPIQTEVNTMAMSKGLQYLFLGGSDGFIRKYDFLNTMDGKLSLTILQKHSLAESIQNAGILMSYWENEVPQKRSEMKLSKNNKEYDPKVSPVYAIEVQSECLFLLSGLDNGGITMQGVRYMEGSIGHYFKSKESHSSVVNQLRLNGDETRFVSGSWDKRLLEWDLKNGDIINEFKGSTSEISSLEMRPLYATVEINDIVREMKQNKNEENGRNSDDDMGSLFGDEEEEDEIKKDEADEAKKPNANLMEEISRDTLNVVYDESVFLTAGLNGSVDLWDRRIPTSPAVSLERGPKVPPWCQSACWSMDGDRIYTGRRNACVEEFDLKMPSRPSNTLRLPAISGPVTCVRAMPNNKQILCASRDNIRLYNTGDNPNSKGTAVPFLIVPGHHGGVISNMYVDPTCRFLVSTSGNRGWQGNSTDTTFIYEIDLE